MTSRVKFCKSSFNIEGITFPFLTSLSCPSSCYPRPVIHLAYSDSLTAIHHL